MQVFNLYLKVLNKYKGQIFLYIGIFAGVLFGGILPSIADSSVPYFEESKCNVAIFNYDNSGISNSVENFIKEKHNIESIANEDKETIQDELYQMNVDAVIVFKEGFEQSFIEGDSQKGMDIYVVPGTVTANLLERNIDSYLKTVDTYMQSGMNLDEAATQAKNIGNITVDVEMSNGEIATEHNEVYYFFLYLVWIMVAMCVNAITPVLCSLKKEGVQTRIECSSYKFSRRNVEILLGVICTGLIMGVFFILMAMGTFKGEFLNMKGLLYTINMFVYILVALALTFMISRITNNSMIISMFANIISLGMSFLSGVFVPIEFLNDTVISIAHFLPSYWYVKTMMLIESFTSDKVGEIISYMGIQILFVLAIITISITISKRKRVA